MRPVDLGQALLEVRYLTGAKRGERAARALTGAGMGGTPSRPTDLREVVEGDGRCVTEVGYGDTRA